MYNQRSFSRGGPQRSSRGFAPRGGGGFRQGGASRGPRPAYIHPSRYINHAQPVAPAEEVQIKHKFTDFAIDPQIVSQITSHGYSVPTPIQDQALEPALAGRDIIGIANTGTGKTAAFLIPIIQKILLDKNQGALIVVPTRELASQVQDEARAFIGRMPIGSVLCVGGLSIEPQIRTLSRNPHIVIGTPGRLKDLIERRAFRPEMFTTVVLDEVDRMLDIGFRKDVEYLISLMPRERHGMVFSATVTPDVDRVIQTLLRNPVRVSVKVTETNEHIDQDVIRVVPGQNKIDILHNLLVQPDFQRVLVFGRTKHGVNKLEEILSEKGLRVDAIHGNKSQAARQRALDSFKRGRTKVLIATDVAARGIDINDVTHVINFDEPMTYDDYVHRIGRTGRAGKVGKALTFIQ
ncbi:MAG TPA: DEAD/DEAH box helicase [Patescibacteria group bacterium]|nr:DEAD/DEAH box helicase [Patescibacteria group bacterium]